MQQKTFWVDVETTGLSPVANDIIQIAILIDIDGCIVDKVYANIAPIDFSTVSPEALKVNGLTMEDIKKFDNPRGFYRSTLIPLLSKYIDKYNKQDKFTIAGYNVGFDKGFLENFFKKNGNKYFGSYFSHQVLDPMHLAIMLRYYGMISTDNLKLKTLCDHYKIDINAHDALSDVEATRSLMRLFYDRYLIKEA